MLRLSDDVLNGARCMLGHAWLRRRIRLGAGGEHHWTGLWLRLKRDQLRLLTGAHMLGLCLLVQRYRGPTLRAHRRLTCKGEELSRGMGLVRPVGAIAIEHHS